MAQLFEFGCQFFVIIDISGDILNDTDPLFEAVEIGIDDAVE
jgi:hypothetical protein